LRNSRRSPGRNEKKRIQESGEKPKTGLQGTQKCVPLIVKSQGVIPAKAGIRKTGNNLNHDSHDYRMCMIKIRVLPRIMVRIFLF
jgi:hypothetical protein